MRSTILACGLIAFAITPVAAAQDMETELARKYYQLLANSRHSQPEPHSAVNFSRVAPLRKLNGNGSHSRANASLLKAGRCHLIYATTAHALMDNSYRYRVPPQDIEIRGHDGQWLKAMQLVTSAQAPRREDESLDWGLAVVALPDCDGARYQPLDSAPVDAAALKRCDGAIEMTCYHFDGDQATLMREQHCRLIAEPRQLPEDSHHIGYMSCDQREGVSGCAPVCRDNGVERAMGVFNYGLRASSSSDSDQQVGVFRALDGEFYRALVALARRYELR